MPHLGPVPPELSRQETAHRAGVGVDVVDRYVELGLLKPAEGDRFTSGDVRRITVIETMARAGMPLEGIAEVRSRGEASLEFLDSPLYARFASLSTTTFRQLAERTGLPVESLMVIREATGAAAPEPDDLVREDELDVVPVLEVTAAEGISLASTERLLRVMGDSMRRITEAQATWWQTEVALPMIAQGASGNLGNATLEFGSQLNPIYEQALMALMHAHEQRTWTANILEATELILSNAGLYRRVQRPPAMCFLDITGYTRLTSERGDEAAAELASSFSRMVQRTSHQYAGRAVKWLGDGVMFYFTDPGPGVVAALEMVEGTAEAGLPPAHVGLHAGPVLIQDGDYFGQTVNLAARIADYARPGEVLVSQAVVEQAEGAAASFTEIGPVELKGVSEATRLHVARRDPAGG
ncbi:MAG TPA: adenylate/guanylate cyclase domain-containing protein [Candidatus Limnocylindria bacterium]|nr:adenylate/guanylate cyclase domain-containing protein [Candidatus Limnocylindria bacterium]